MSKRLTTEDYHRAAAERGIEWVGQPVNNHKTKTEWRCKEGHRYFSSYNSVMNSSRACPHCAGNIPKTAEDYCQLAVSLNLEWLGALPRNASKKTSWRCGKGHIFTVGYSMLKFRGGGCPYCNGRIRKTASDYYLLAAANNLQWIAEANPPANTSEPTQWKCPKGHLMNSAYDNIRQGHGCLTCANEQVANASRRKSSDYHALAAAMGFRWIESVIGNNKTLVEWECPRSHRFLSSYNNIARGHGCPHCLDLVNSQPVSRPQRAICEMVGGELNHPVGSYRVDVALAINGTKIAIEYDGWYWHQGRDGAERDNTLISAGWRVLHIRSDMLLPSQEQLDDAIRLLVGGVLNTEIVLADWGLTRQQMHGRKREHPPLT